jgi:predicted MFS family arabinose efflux permease
VSAPAQATDAAARRAQLGARATHAAFIGSGFAFASWASRIPQVRDRLQLSPAGLGLLLLSAAVGSLIALPLAGIMVNRFSSRRTVQGMSVLLSLALATIAVGITAGIVPVVIGLFWLGFSNGAWDVSMNVQGATVERQLGRAIMPRFHAGFSVGTVLGALGGAAMISLHVSVTLHLLVAAAIVAAAIPVAVRWFLPDTDRPSEETESAGHVRDALARWRERRTLLVGVLVLAFAFAEGTGNDWISVAVIDGYHATAVVGTLAFAAFLAAMTTGRWFGPALLDRHGRVAVVRVTAGVAVVGLLLFVFSPITALALVGAVLWGAGTSLGFPVGMSAAADEPAAAAARVSVVASIGYCAFLGGPPLIGFLGSHLTVLRSLTAVAVLLAVAVLVAGALRPVPVQHSNGS